MDVARWGDAFRVRGMGPRWVFHPRSTGDEGSLAETASGIHPSGTTSPENPGISTSHLNWSSHVPARPRTRSFETGHPGIAGRSAPEDRGSRVHFQRHLAIVFSDSWPSGLSARPTPCRPAGVGWEAVGKVRGVPGSQGQLSPILTTLKVTVVSVGCCPGPGVWEQTIQFRSRT